MFFSGFSFADVGPKFLPPISRRCHRVLHAILLFGKASKATWYVTSPLGKYTNATIASALSFWLKN